MRFTSRVVASLALALAAVPLHAAGAGVYLYEFGSPSVGLASAGYAARAGDAETLFTNPAGMVRLERPELLAGAQALYANLSFSPGAGTTVQGSSGGNAVGWLPGGSVFLVIGAMPRLKLGVGVLSYVGAALEYEPGWVGRYYGHKETLLGFSFMPTAAYRVTEWLSVGAGLNAMLGVLRTTVAVNNLLPGRADGQLSLKDETWGFGANVGVLLEPDRATRIGVTWLSAVKLGFGATPSFTGLGPGLQLALGAAGLLDSPIGLGVTLPNRIMVGVHRELGPRWSVMADVGWEDWSRFGMVEVSVDAANTTSLTKTVSTRDAWHGAVGTRFAASDAWALSGGIAYDGSMISDSARTVLTPLGAAWRFGLGVQWAVSRTVSLGLDDTFVWGGDLPLDQQRGPLAGRVQGTFGDSFINVVAANVRWVI